MSPLRSPENYCSCSANASRRQRCRVRRVREDPWRYCRYDTTCRPPASRQRWTMYNPLLRSRLLHWPGRALKQQSTPQMPPHKMPYSFLSFYFPSKSCQHDLTGATIMAHGSHRMLATRVRKNRALVNAWCGNARQVCRSSCGFASEGAQVLYDTRIERMSFLRTQGIQDAGESGSPLSRG